MTTKRLLTWIVAVILFGVVVWLVLKDPATVEALRSISVLQIVALLGLQIVYLIVESRRLEIVIEDASRTRIPSLHMLSLFSVGRTLNLVVPQAGNVYRGVRLNQRYGIAATNYAGALGAFVWMTVILSLVTSGVVLAFTQSDVTVASLPLWAVMIVASFILTVIPIGIYLMASSAIDGRSSDTVVGKIGSVVAAAAEAVKNPTLVVKFVVTWLVTLAVIGPMYMWTFSIVDQSVTIGAAIAIYGLVQVTSFVVITPGNIGILELGFTGLAVLLGVPASAAAAAAGLIRATGILATVGTAMATGWSDLVDASTHRGADPSSTSGDDGSP
ncbi:MAG: flippase-like domain-containing protein [Actinomycetia bacterium]|nr:flippase-like domain-containing protein [Actinomycetes bacterium]